MISLKRLTYLASTRKNYDLIAIGAHASKIAKMVNNTLPNNLMTKLIVNNNNQLLEAQLINTPSPYIQLNNQFKHNEKWDIQLTRPVVKIVPEQCKVIFAGGEECYYRQLVYSPSSQDCKNVNCFDGLADKLAVPHTFVYADYHLNNSRQLFKRLNGNIYFTVPSTRNFSSQNLIMANLIGKLRQQLPARSRHNLPFSVKLVYEGDTLVPFNNEIDQTIRSLLQKQGVTLINSNINNINYQQMSIELSNGVKQTFSSIFHYLPYKTPTLLQQASIDPFKTNQHTLNHSEYDNIFIVGNNLPTINSFYTLNFVNHVVAKNVIKKYMRSKLGQFYNGEGFIPFWDSHNSLRYFSFDYSGTWKYNNVGSEKWMGRLLGLDKQFGCRYELNQYYNGNSFGVPFYFWSPNLKDPLQDKPILSKK